MTGHVPRIKAQLSLTARRRVAGLLEGEYASVQTGRGMEFNDLRVYVRGDDVKDLDWKASARTGEMLIRRYVAVRQHTVLLVVSTGRSMAAAHSFDVGGRAVGKRDLAVEVAGLLGWLAVRQGDRVTAVWGDAAAQHGLPPGAGELHLERCLAAAYDAVGVDSAPSDLVALLRYVARTVRRRTIALVVCDEVEATPELVAALRRLSVQHEVLMVTVGDVDPVAVPAGAGVSHDVDRGASLPAWVRGDAGLLAELDAVQARDRATLHEALVRVGVVHAHLEPGGTALAAVRQLLVGNAHARRR